MIIYLKIQKTTITIQPCTAITEAFNYRTLAPKLQRDPYGTTASLLGHSQVSPLIKADLGDQIWHTMAGKLFTLVLPLNLLGLLQNFWAILHSSSTRYNVKFDTGHCFK